MTVRLPNIDWRLRVALVAALTVLAAWLRFSATDFGLPDQLRPDEEMTVPTALGFENDWNPHLAIYPAAQTYLIHGVLRSYAMLTGAGRDLHVAYGSDNNAPAFLLARRLSAAMGAATVPIIYLAAAPVYGPTAALVSSAILTVAYIHVRESKFAKVEVPAGFWLALSILSMLRIVQGGRSIDYALAGVFCGLAAATHYTSGTISVGILVAHLEMRHREARSLIGSLVDPRIYLAGLASILTFLCADPYFVLDWTRTVHDYAFLNVTYQMWNGGSTPAGFGWPWLLFRAMPAALGIELEIFLLAALPWVLFRPRPGTLALLAFIAACFLSLTSGHPQLEFRYLVNPLLAMSILAGLLAIDLIALICSWLGVRSGYAVAALAGIILLAPSAFRDLQLNQFLRRKDTRTIARKWMLAHIPPSTAVVLIGGENYGKPKIPGQYQLVSVDGGTLSLGKAIDQAKWVVSDSFPPLSLWSGTTTDAQIDLLNARGTLEFDLDPIKAGAPEPVFDPNDAFFVPFNHFTSVTRPGPRIRIWKLKKNPGDVN